MIAICRFRQGKAAVRMLADLSGNSTRTRGDLRGDHVLDRGESGGGAAVADP